MPRLWNETIAEHRRDVRDAIMDATWALVAEDGLAAVKMAHIAQRTGIGRATLYKYFPDVESILIAWHERHVADHLARLLALQEQDGTAVVRLRRVLTRYAEITQRRGSHAFELAALLQRHEHVDSAHARLSGLITALVTEAAEAGDIRTDVSAEELAHYCLHALAAAATLHTGAAVDRLVVVTMAGLSAPAGSALAEDRAASARPDAQANHQVAHQELPPAEEISSAEAVLDGARRGGGGVDPGLEHRS